MTITVMTHTTLIEVIESSDEFKRLVYARLKAAFEAAIFEELAEREKEQEKKILYGDGSTEPAIGILRIGGA